VSPLNDVLPGRLLAMDVGARRIGLAVSDLLGITAQGIETLQRKNKRTDLEKLAKVIGEYTVTEIVVGYPLRMSGVASAQTGHVEAFAQDLEKKFGLPVHRWDERLTSVQAGRVLRESNISIEKRAQAVDRLAAVLILQSFLDHRAMQRANAETDRA
jgi:putative Holliday junction resolvase